jgi:gliding motility-associated-like protein
LLFFSALNAQYTSLDNNSGYWIDSSDWESNMSPGTSVISSDINIYGEIISLNCLEINLGRLTVFDTLVINGNLILQNKAELFIEEGAVVMVFGDYTSKNKVAVNNRGTFLVVANFEMLGSDNQGEFINNGSVYIFDNSPTFKGDTSTNDLVCIKTEEGDSCGYFAREQFESNRFFYFYNNLPFSDREFLDSNNPCYALDFYTEKTLFCKDEMVRFYLTSLGIEPTNDIWWQFGLDAVPSEAIGPGPHEVYYSASGTKEIILIDKFDTDLYVKKEIEVAEMPNFISISKVTEADKVYIPYVDQVCINEFSEYTTDGNSDSKYIWTIPSLKIDKKTNNNIRAKWDVEPGEYLIFAQEVNYAGCTGEVCEGLVLVTECQKEDEGVIERTTYAFSPNNDNINETWVIPGIDKYPLAKIVVFNKRGKTLFISEKNYMNDWDGSANGKKLPLDSYYYIIDLSAYNQKSIKGIVSIFW